MKMHQLVGLSLLRYVGIFLSAIAISAGQICSISDYSHAISDSDPSLHLAGATNARDIGVYTTRSGAHLRQGKIFRSNRLDKLTNSDKQVLASLHVQEIIDLRTPHEISQHPDVPLTGVRDVNYDILGSMQYPAERPPYPPPPGQVNHYFTAQYIDFVDDPGERRMIGRIIREIVREVQINHPILYHCSSGKDRTGWITAVLLSAVDVPYPTVLRDYMLSNTYLQAQPDQLQGVDSIYLNAAYKKISSRFRNFTRYWQQGLGLSLAERDQLRAHLVETHH